jgi:hypothetical protein
MTTRYIIMAISREEAKNAHRTRYFTGKQCKQGHVSERLVINYSCCECNKNRVKKHQEKYPELWRNYVRNWRKNNPQKAQENYRRAGRKRQNLPEPTRAEPPVCEICCEPPSGRDRALCLDHDHATGLFRGWICRKCNSGLGNFRDSIELLNTAISYLKSVN